MAEVTDVPVFYTQNNICNNCENHIDYQTTYQWIGQKEAICPHCGWSIFLSIDVYVVYDLDKGENRSTAQNFVEGLTGETLQLNEAYEDIDWYIFNNLSFVYCYGCENVFRPITGHTSGSNIMPGPWDWDEFHDGIYGWRGSWAHSLSDDGKRDKFFPYCDTCKKNVVQENRAKYNETQTVLKQKILNGQNLLENPYLHYEKCPYCNNHPNWIRRGGRIPHCEACGRGLENNLLTALNTSIDTNYSTSIEIAKCIECAKILSKSKSSTNFARFNYEVKLASNNSTALFFYCDECIQNVEKPLIDPKWEQEHRRQKEKQERRKRLIKEQERQKVKKAKRHKWYVKLVLSLGIGLWVLSVCLSCVGYAALNNPSVVSFLNPNSVIGKEPVDVYDVNAHLYNDSFAKRRIIGIEDYGFALKFSISLEVNETIKWRPEVINNPEIYILTANGEKLYASEAGGIFQRQSSTLQGTHTGWIAFPHPKVTKFELVYLDGVAEIEFYE